MAKRQADYQLTRDSGEDIGDDAENTPAPQANPEDLGRRVIRGLPKRGKAPTSPSKGPEAGNSASASSIFPAFPTPPSSNSSISSSFPPSFPTSSSAPIFGSSSSTTAFSSPPKSTHDTGVTKLGEDGDLLDYYKKLRGLNHSLLTAVQQAVSEDPFTNLGKLLDEASKNYSHHYQDIQSSRDKSKKSISAPPSLPGLPAVASGFSFGGQTVTTSSSKPVTNGATPSSGFLPSFTPPTSFTFGSSTPSSAPKSSETKESKPFETAKSSADSSSADNRPPRARSPLGMVPNPAFGTGGTAFGFPSAKPSSTPTSLFGITGAFVPPSSSSSTTTATGASSAPSNPFAASGSPTKPSAFSSFGSSPTKPSPFAKTMDESKDGEEGESKTGSHSQSKSAASVFGGTSSAFGAPSTSVFGSGSTGASSAPPAPAAKALPSIGLGRPQSPPLAKSPSPGITAFGSGTPPKPTSFGSSVGFGFGFGGAAPKKADGDDAKEGDGGKADAASSGSGAPAKFLFGSSSGASGFGSSAASNPFASLSSSSTAPAPGAGATSSTSPFGAVLGSGGTFKFGATTFGGGSSTGAGASASTGFGASSFTPSAAFSPFTIAAGSKPVTDTAEGADESTPAAAFELHSTADVEGAGEENETTEFVTRGKWLIMKDGKWEALGVGSFKVKKNKETEKMRVLFRTEGNGNVIGNYNIWSDLRAKKLSPKFVQFPGFDAGGEMVSYGLQVKNPQQVEDAVEALTKAAAASKS